MQFTWSSKVGRRGRWEVKMGVKSELKEGRLQRVWVKCPYDRSVVTVVGPNHILHDN